MAGDQEENPAVAESDARASVRGLVTALPQPAARAAVAVSVTAVKKWRYMEAPPLDFA
jgi:hypothetical protein